MPQEGQGGDRETHASFGRVSHDLAFPDAVKFNSRGELAALQGSGAVVRINRVTHAVRLVAKLQPGLDNLAFDARDHLFVSHGGNGRLWRILPSGVPRRLVEAGLVMPGGIVPRHQIAARQVISRELARAGVRLYRRTLRGTRKGACPESTWSHEAAVGRSPRLLPNAARGSATLWS